MYTNVYLDFTCIEIFENENFKNYLEIDKSINCENPLEEYKNDLLVIMQCPGNEDVSYTEGRIIDFRNINQRIIHSVSTKEGSSGSPIILSHRNLNVIGIYNLL